MNVYIKFILFYVLDEIMENTVAKRKDGCVDCESATLKKARHSWQVKRSDREDISSVTDVVICDNISSCQHCNLRGDKSLCQCNLDVSCVKFNKPAEISEKDMDCSSSNMMAPTFVRHESQINQVKKYDYSDQKSEGTTSTPYLQNTVSSAIPDYCSSIHNFSRTSSPVSSSGNFSFDGQQIHQDMQKEDGRTSVSTNLSNRTSILALPSSSTVDPEIEEEGLLISHRQREEELNLYLKRWQNQHIAKSIVDNAINKTLEEMGVSPEPQQFVTNLIESQGISEAIKLQGLIPQSQCNHLGPVEVLSNFAESNTYFMSLTNQQISNNISDVGLNAGTSTTNHDILDHAVSVAIGSKGLIFHDPGK